jgi:hypothetical protein
LNIISYGGRAEDGDEEGAIVEAAADGDEVGAMVEEDGDEVGAWWLKMGMR